MPISTAVVMCESSSSSGLGDVEEEQPSVLSFTVLSDSFLSVLKRAIGFRGGLPSGLGLTVVRLTAVTVGGPSVGSEAE